MTTKKNLMIFQFRSRLTCLTVAKLVKFELESFFFISIFLGGIVAGNPRTADITLTMNMIDGPDQAPIFQRDAYEFRIDENNKFGDPINFVRARKAVLTPDRF